MGNAVSWIVLCKAHGYDSDAFISNLKVKREELLDTSSQPRCVYHKHFFKGLLQSFETYGVKIKDWDLYAKAFRLLEKECKKMDSADNVMYQLPTENHRLYHSIQVVKAYNAGQKR